MISAALYVLGFLWDHWRDVVSIFEAVDHAAEGSKFWQDAGARIQARGRDAGRATRRHRIRRRGLKHRRHHATHARQEKD